VARISQRLARLLESALGDDGVGGPVEFLYKRAAADLALAGGETLPDSTEVLLGMLPGPSPLARLRDGYGLHDLEIELMLLAGLPEIHEGYADLLRSVNPNNQARVATGLAAQMLCPHGQREELEQLLLAGPAVRGGLLQVSGDGPLFTRQLVLAECLWQVLHGIDAWPAEVGQRFLEPAPWGLDEWLSTPDSVMAVEGLRRDRDLVVRVQGADRDSALNRAAVLAQHAGRSVACFQVHDQTAARQLGLAALHCRARGLAPLFSVVERGGERRQPIVLPPRHPGAMLVSGIGDDGVEYGRHSLLQINLQPLRRDSHLSIWQNALGEGRGDVVELATRFPLEPDLAGRVARDLDSLTRVDSHHVARQLRARCEGLSRAGINLIHPKAGWSRLVLPKDRLEQLHEAVARLPLQSRVLHSWGFLKDRHGARGLRLLCAGPPGTGKTLSAEVIAHALGVDLLIVDVSRVVSKWIGETEKNLEQAFAAAERTRAVLLFDEADALFGKRTEVSDANDRYANLETAYLLTRLERFEGLAVMSTNLRGNIDPAFIRRMDYIVEYDEPARAERAAIWREHVPDTAPLNRDVDFNELAALFPVVGGVIRNAAVGAAFRAASADRSIARDDFIHALRREYEKQGKAFPGASTGLAQNTRQETDHA